MSGSDFSVTSGITIVLGGGGPGGTSRNPLNSGPRTSGGSSRSGPSTGARVPKPPAGISDPSTGRETPDAPVEFLTWDGYHGATGTAPRILDQLPALFKCNDARAKSASLISGGTTALRLPGGYVVQFSNDFALTMYLSRSAQPAVPTAAVMVQSVLGRASSDQDVAQAESAFNAGQLLADYRAGLIASPEVANTLEGISRQVLGRDATATELDADKTQLGAGTSMGDLRSGLAHSAEAAADVAGLFGSMLGRPASAADVAGREAQLATGARFLTCGKPLRRHRRQQRGFGRLPKPSWAALPLPTTWRHAAFAGCAGRVA